jgi:menaquinone-9 beta-reductase
MNNQSQIPNPKSQIVIVGAGPAGASLAIRLARTNFDVTLIERENFPRHKLCGEFVSPECLAHFADLDILDEMLSIGGDRISQTIFYALNGKNVTVPSEWFGNSQGALGISRAEMDLRLLEKAKEIGVKVLEETSVVGLLFENEKVCGVKIKSKTGETSEIASNLTIDATGRANVLGKLAQKFQLSNSRFQTKSQITSHKSQISNRLVGFKAHLENVHLEKGRCEIYFFRGGYGGLSYVEKGRANHCFLIKAEIVKKYVGQTNLLLEEVIFENRRARETMKNSSLLFEWLAVSVDGFGRKNLNPAENLFTVGDAAAFIDPFTGSGMLMALESAEILANCIVKNQFSVEQIAPDYDLLHRANFNKRLRICKLMRNVAFVPNFAGMVISALNLSSSAREIVARATRRNLTAEKIKS